MDFLKNIKIIFTDIKIAHTVFALPFAVMSAFLAAEGMPGLGKLIWILIAMFGARNGAMAFNRIVDSKLDRLNPRTKDRALPARKSTAKQYWVFLILSSFVFLFSAYMLNSLAFALSPVALVIVFGYSFAKRFTSLSHLWLGVAISIAPVGAWVAVREEISIESLVLGTAVVFWLVGFDIIYSCMDVDSDRSNNLHSIPQKFGVRTALRLAFSSHCMMILFLILLLFIPALGWVYFFGVILTAGLLFYEHSLVREDDLSLVNVAFFNINGIISVLLMLFVIVDCTWY
ncbi:MAG: putative 4-hydroxybenzoate polyprenyltransferase [Nitrospinales bacterium]|nr:putative 4-hydroxybenzoate polyprenyltransferase [Nitrospinales bacterium]